MKDKKYFTYEVKNSSGDYHMVRTNDNKILAFTEKENLMEFVKSEKTSGLLRILDITEDITMGNILLNHLEILD